MIDILKDTTYMVRHNPNCPKRFEVRLSGMALLMQGILGFGSLSRPEMKTGDDVGYGDTAEEAAQNALATRTERLERTLHAPQRARVFNKVWREDRL